MLCSGRGNLEARQKREIIFAQRGGGGGGGRERTEGAGEQRGLRSLRRRALGLIVRVASTLARKKGNREGRSVIEMPPRTNRPFGTRGVGGGILDLGGEPPHPSQEGLPPPYQNRSFQIRARNEELRARPNNFHTSNYFPHLPFANDLKQTCPRLTRPRLRCSATRSCRPTSWNTEVRLGGRDGGVASALGWAREGVARELSRH